MNNDHTKVIEPSKKHISTLNPRFDSEVETIAMQHILHFVMDCRSTTHLHRISSIKVMQDSLWHFFHFYAHLAEPELITNDIYQDAKEKINDALGRDVHDNEVNFNH